MTQLLRFRVQAVFASVILFAMAGCQNGEKPPAPSSSTASSAESTAPPEEVLEATTVKVEVDGESLVQLTSFLDDFQITLPLDFRGTILTEREIALFTSRIKSEVAQLAEQIQSQCGSLRSSGGVLFAMNMRPASVVDGFADNMNVSIRGMETNISLAEVKKLMVNEISSQKPDVKISASEIDSEAGRMLEIQFSSQEGPTKTNVNRFIFATVREHQIFTVAFACAKSKATKIAPAFRKSAQSLSYL